MSNANVAHVQNLYAAFGRGDVAGILAGLTADVDWQTVGRPKDFPTLGPRKGSAQVQEFFKLVAEHEDFSDFTPREFHAADDKVFVLGSYSSEAQDERHADRERMGACVHPEGRQGRALPRAHRYRAVRRGIRAPATSSRWPAASSMRCATAASLASPTRCSRRITPTTIPAARGPARDRRGSRT